MSENAAIILFVYNRPIHTEKTLIALANNYLSNSSDLYIFSDNASNGENVHKVADVRKIIVKKYNFRNIYIFKRDRNYGLSKNIISGINQVSAISDKFIVIEDDIIVSQNFLTYMNKSLNFYQNFKKVWHVNGWSHPINFTKLENIFFIPQMHCWGWGSWSDRWSNFKKNPKYLIDNWSNEMIFKFNVNGTHDNFWKQVLFNYQKKSDSWAIFWYATIFENNGLCLSANKSYTLNIGNDGSGIHKVSSKFYDSTELNNFIPNIFPNKIKISSEALIKIEKYYNKGYYLRYLKKSLKKLLNYE